MKSLYKISITATAPYVSAKANKNYHEQHGIVIEASSGAQQKMNMLILHLMPTLHYYLINNESELPASLKLIIRSVRV